MPTALGAVLTHLFDDAGLFPPAKLPMAEALAAHARALRAPHSRVVGPFLCPATRLAELDACVASGSTAPPAIGVIGYDGQLDWRAAFARRGLVQVEAPLAARVPRPPGRVIRYMELPQQGAIDVALDAVVAAGARAKIRCGGQTWDAVPPVRWVAEVLVGCVARRLVLKATAGLHHPYYAEVPGGVRHGFVNLLAAAAHARTGAPVVEVAEVLATDESHTDAPALRVAGARTLTAGVTGARALIASIGTCSIDEPVDAVTARGLL